MSERAAIQKQKETIAAKKQEITQGLPHLYEMGWYAWAWAFFKSKNKMNLLCAGNQLSKSSSQIRKAIEWAGNPILWPELWPKHTPRVFWYFYPDQDTVNSEVENKWIPEFLPRFNYRDHPTYGWKIVYGEKKAIEGIKFNSGVMLYFKTYSQKISNLQSGTIAAIFADEELPEEFYSELSARLFASDGYFHMVFTATRNQAMWKRAIEGKGDNELFPEAHKQQITMFDCLAYRDGRPGAYTVEKIDRIIKSCKSQAEVDRRVFGKFVAATGLKYGNFDSSRHFKKPFRIPDGWQRYAGVDIGSGGDNHKPAIVFVAVRPDYRFGVVYKAWRGDDGSTYTNGDVLNKFLELRKNDFFVSQRYDGGAKDFGTLSGRASEGFVKAEKSHDLGEDVLNTLFQNNMLLIFDDEGGQKLGGELGVLLKDTAKNKAKDDLCDALRYAVVTIPWDWMSLKGEKSDTEKEKDAKKPLTDEERLAQEIDERRGDFNPRETEGWQELEDDFNEWNEFAGS